MLGMQLSTRLRVCLRACQSRLFSSEIEVKHKEVSVIDDISKEEYAAAQSELAKRVEEAEKNKTEAELRRERFIKFQQALREMHESESRHPLRIFGGISGTHSAADMLTIAQRWTTNPYKLRQYWLESKMRKRILTQMFIETRHEILGFDLAASHFVMFRGGRVKFHGSEKWYQMEFYDRLRKTVPLPAMYDPRYKLTHIDASGTEIVYEGFANFLNLRHLKWLRLRGCPYFDDWCLDRLSGLLLNVEYLDLSDLPRMTNYGLECLYRLKSLKKLVLNGWVADAELKLICLLLEDVIPGLEFEGIDPYDKATIPMPEPPKLLSEPNADGDQQSENVIHLNSEPRAAGVSTNSDTSYSGSKHSKASVLAAKSR